MSRLGEDSHSTGPLPASDTTDRAMSGGDGLIVRALREPLVHFCIIGAMMFGMYYWFSDEELGALPDGKRIEITTNDIQQIVVAWLAQGRLPLTPDQLESLVDQKIAEEVLYRGAGSRSRSQ